MPLEPTVPVMSFGVVVRLAPRNRLVNAGQVCPDAGKANAPPVAVPFHATAPCEVRYV